MRISMKIIPKAKPVKIRIKSGGKEHSSLESLKQNFAIQDIIPLLDGRLERWLRQQGNDQVADDVKAFGEVGLETDEGLFGFIKCFFNEELQRLDVKTPIQLAEYWSNVPYYKKDSEWLYKYLLRRNSVAAKCLYRNNLIQDVNWFDIFSNFESEEDGEILYILGILLINGDYVVADEDRGMSYVEKAAKCKYEEAIQYLIDYKVKRSSRVGKSSETVIPPSTEECKKIGNRFECVDVDKMKKLVQKIWQKRDISPYYMSINQKEEKIINFIRICRAILDKSAELSWKELLSFAQERFSVKTITPADMFYNEKLFIVGLIYKNCGQWGNAKALFEKSSEYQPSRSFLQGVEDDIRRMHFPQLIEYVVDNLFYYE